MMIASAPRETGDVARFRYLCPVSYVRNDPVNLIDPDGRLVAAPNGNGPWFLWGDWDSPSPVYTINNDGYPVLVSLQSGGGSEPGNDIGAPDIPGTDPGVAAILTAPHCSR